MEKRRDKKCDELLDRAAEAMRHVPVPEGPPPEAVVRVLQGIGEVHVFPLTIATRHRKMNRIAKIAAAASVLLAIGLLVMWLTLGGGSTNIAFAEVAKAMESLRTATYDYCYEVTTEMKDSHTVGKTVSTVKSKIFFLAPSHYRMEMSVSSSLGSNENKMNSIMIWDSERGKRIELMPDSKVAKPADDANLKARAGEPSDMFEKWRRIVRERNSSTGDKVEQLGTKEIEGRKMVGFQIHSGAGDTSDETTLWADPETALPVRIETAGEGKDFTSHTVMDNFRYDVELDSAMFSLEPPAGYTLWTPDEDFIIALRVAAEARQGRFPEHLEIIGRILQSVLAVAAKPETDKVLAKYGGQLALLNPPPGMMDECKKATMPSVVKLRQPLQGAEFYKTLKPANDAHYAGKDVKLDTPDRPIFWYKPTGGEKYRVIYADLSVKEVAPAELKNFPETAVPTEDDLLKTLRIVAKTHGDKFPMTIERMNDDMRIAMSFGSAMIVLLNGIGSVEALTDWGIVQEKQDGQQQRGMAFYKTLKPENDSHYVGGSVKLGTPDRPIFWYKPTGSEKYRVIYADLSVKEMSPDEVKSLPEAKPE